MTVELRERLMRACFGLLGVLVGAAIVRGSGGEEHAVRSTTTVITVAGPRPTSASGLTDAGLELNEPAVVEGSVPPLPEPSAPFSVSPADIEADEARAWGLAARYDALVAGGFRDAPREVAARQGITDALLRGDDATARVAGVACAGGLCRVEIAHTSSTSATEALRALWTHPAFAGASMTVRRTTADGYITVHYASQEEGGALAESEGL